MNLKRPFHHLAQPVFALLVLLAISLHAPEVSALPHSAPEPVGVALQHVAAPACHHHGSGSGHTACVSPVIVLTAAAAAPLPPARQGFPRPGMLRLQGRVSARHHRPPIRFA